MMGFAYNYFVLSDFFLQFVWSFIKKHLPLQHIKKEKQKL